MKITILSNKDLASCVALNYLLPLLEEHEVKVFLSARVGKSAPQPRGLEDLKFFEQQLFNDIVFPLADALAPVSPQLFTFNGLAERMGNPITELNAINTVGFERFESSEPDLVLSIRYGGILKDAVIVMPKFGVLNLHSGLLPDYKGVMASFRALLNGDSTLGTTLHSIDDAGIDTGRIIGTTSLTVDRARSYLWHVLELYRDGCQLMAGAVAALARGEQLEFSPQSSGGNYFSFPSEAELETFAKTGFSLADTDELDVMAKRFLLQ